MEEWKTYKYTELCTLVGGGTPKTTVPEYWDGNIPWLSVKDFGGGKKYVYTTEKTITELGLKNSTTKLLEKDDIIISARGTIGEIAMIPSDMAFNQSCFGIRAKADLIDPHYLYYLTKTKVAELKKASHGSVFDTITRDTFDGISCELPDLNTQKQVSQLLSSIDNKIELNNRINHNLEQQAQALYKSWFVDFEPFKDGKFVNSELGMIPEGWQVVNLDSLCSIISRGFSPKYSNSTTDIVLGQRCVRNNMIDLKVSRTHTPKNLGERALRQYDILINSTGMGSLGRVAQIYFKPERMTFDSHLTLVRAKSSILEMYIGRNLLSRQDEIENMAVGSTGQTELPRDSVKNMSILYPCDVVLKQFGDCIRAITGRIQSNLTENTELALLRDKLLPRLMSGELKINDLTC